MSRELVIEETGFGLRAGVLDGGRLIEVRDADRDEARVSEAVFTARVSAVDPKLNAAFLECGLARPGLIVAKDARAAAGAAERRPVRELLREGQRLIVQGLREPGGDKGARFTSDVKLFGFALVHAPAALPADATRRGSGELHMRGAALFPDGRFALRRHAAGLEDAALRVEAGLLAARWQRLQAAARGAKPGRLPEPESVLERLLRGTADLEPRSVTVADAGIARELERLVAATPTLPPFRVQRLDGDASAFAQLGLNEALEAALGPAVPLPGGGRLIIEPTAACVAIDVDGGGRAPLETDLAAVNEIARQVRLRNLGGSIVIDFVDLPHKHERHRLEESLKRAFRHDPAPVEVHPMSPLGIVQVSRARRGEPLASRLGAACPCCAGTGRVTAPRLAAERLMKALAGVRRPPDAVSAATDLSRFLAEEGRGAWARQTARLGYAPRIVADAGLACGEFRFEGADDAR